MDRHQQHFTTIKTCSSCPGLQLSAGSWWRHHEPRTDMLKIILLRHQNVQSDLCTTSWGRPTSKRLLSLLRTSSHCGRRLWLLWTGSCRGWFHSSSGAACVTLTLTEPRRNSPVHPRCSFCLCSSCIGQQLMQWRFRFLSRAGKRLLNGDYGLTSGSRRYILKMKCWKPSRSIRGYIKVITWMRIKCGDKRSVHGQQTWQR